ncbi:uncharacterized protein RSE6_09601 [Rhynchosporium secalis]|uniref:Uncharacterized protein n=1 Tax=Rhynchosporium secalis TaxID=38038 RepID=A0A1E1MIE8_RHYSE|nr:uncharacterized protein RSE6_09601 [Rhynchosporium secalis]
MSWECSERVARLLVALMDRLQYSDGYPSGRLSKVFRPKIYRSFIPPISSFKANGRVPHELCQNAGASISQSSKPCVGYYFPFVSHDA